MEWGKGRLGNSILCSMTQNLFSGFVETDTSQGIYVLCDSQTLFTRFTDHRNQWPILALLSSSNVLSVLVIMHLFMMEITITFLRV